MSVTIGGVTCQEIIRDYSEGVDPTARSTKSYLCPWRNRFLVANTMLGFATAPSRGAGTIFNPTMQHPEIGGIYAKTVSIRGVGSTDGLGNYQGPAQLAFAYAVIDAGFGPLEWAATPQDDPNGDQAIDPDTKFLYATQNITYGSKSYSVPGSRLQMVIPTPQPPPGNPNLAVIKPINRDADIRVGHAEMAITFHKLPYLPTNFLILQDSVNNDVFLGCAKGTVMFMGATNAREFNLDGGGNSSVSQSITMNFAYRPRYEWNLFPNPYSSSPSDWAIMQYTSGKVMYPYADLSQVWPKGYQY